MEWKPIGRIRNRPDIVANVERGRVDLRVPLDASPDADWMRLFAHPPGLYGVLELDQRSLPRLSGDLIELNVPEEELEAAVAEIDKRIETANEHFRKSVLPRRQAELEHENAQKEENARRLAALREKARKL